MYFSLIFDIMIVIDTKISQHFLSQLVNKQLDAIFAENPSVANKVSIVLQREGDVAIALYENDIILKAPLKIHVSKGEGLFTAEAHGKLIIDIAVELNIDDQLRSSTKTTIRSHEWVDKPILDIGAFEISIEKLTDLGLRFYEPSITGAIDSKLKPLLNFNQIIDDNLVKAQQMTKSNLPKGINVNVIPKGFLLENFNTDAGNINIKAGLDPIVQITSEPEKTKIKKTFRWVETIDQNSLGFIHFEIDYRTLEQIIKDGVKNQDFGGKKVEVTSINFTVADGRLVVNADITKPIGAHVVIKAEPLFNEHEGVIYLSKFDLDIKPSSFIYKIGAPLFTGLVENQIEEFFPLNINTLISNSLKEYLPSEWKEGPISGNLTYKSVKLSELGFESDRVTGMLSYENLNAFINVG